MNEIDLGKLVRVDLRKVWQNEALDFTPWLVANIAVLGELLGFDLEVIKSEHDVGDFSADIVARDLGTKKLVVIENQLEQTDHSHLGQLITYAAGLEASVVVWVARAVREEHRQALDWLNRGEGATTEYFGVILELLQIDGSKPAVNLRVIASPNKWSRTSQRAISGIDSTGRYALYQQFFQRLIDELREKHKFTNARLGQPQNWYTFSSRVRGFQYGASFASGGRIRTEIYIDFGDATLNVTAFETLRTSQIDIEKAFGEPLQWETLDGKRACRIAVYKDGTIEDSSESLEEYRRWCVDHLLRFRSVFSSRLNPVAASLLEKTLVDCASEV